MTASLPESTTLRKYHAATGFSRQQLHLLERLGQRVGELDRELSRVEAIIEERFPTLGLSHEANCSTTEVVMMHTDSDDETEKCTKPKRRTARVRKPR